MSRRKAKRPELALPKVGPRVQPRGLIRRHETGSGFLQEAMRAAAGPNAEIPDSTFEKMGISLNSDEKEIIKEVPAKVDGVIVGTAQIYNDGSCSVVLHEDAPKDLIDKIGGIAGEYGFTIGELFDGSP